MEPDAAERSERRQLVAIYIGLAVLLAGCVGLGIYSASLPERDQTFAFIALLIIFMTALAASSLIFVGLKIFSKDEAFGLPSGSVRALLAIGIMILFVVFGMPVVSSEPKELSSGVVQVPADQLRTVIQLNSEQGFVVRIRDAGAAAGAAGGPPARPATIEIVRMNTVTDAQMDLNKQILTAIITLLTTVIGFYFGSRSAADAIKAAPDAAGDSEPENGNGAGGHEDGGRPDDGAGDPGGGERPAPAEQPETGAAGTSAAAGEATPERFPDGVNRQEADDLPEEARASLPKLDPEENPDAR